MASTPTQDHLPEPADETRDAYDVIEVCAEVGFGPAPSEGWLSRYVGYQPHGAGYLAVTLPDPEAELMLHVLTRSGVTISEARFDLTETGYRMFAGAVEAIR